MRPFQEVRVFGIQDRRSQATARRPWLVRWSIDGRQRSKAFRTKAEADRYRARLLLAVQHGDRFDPATGEPAGWTLAPTVPSVFDWAKAWLGEQWPEWQPRTRRSAIEAIARLVVLTVDDRASTPPTGCRREVAAALVPDGAAPGPKVAEWVGRWSLTLDVLDATRLARVDRLLAVGDDGQGLAASTAARYRKTARACVRRAVELGVLTADPWPPAPRGRTKRKSSRLRKRVDIRRLPDPATMTRILDAIPSHQPGSHKYRVMTALVYYAGLRPSEVVMLRRHSLHLAGRGWGSLDVTEADTDFDEPGEPKTGPRTVPIPPVLVGVLREWLDSAAIVQPDQLLFRTRTGQMPTPSNWNRTWHRARRKVGANPLRIYDCRHAAATTWLQAGVPLGEVAARLGHSVDTLVSTYVGAINGDDEIANRRIQAALDAASHAVERSTA